jgi:hypothetical protein
VKIMCVLFETNNSQRCSFICLSGLHSLQSSIESESHRRHLFGGVSNNSRIFTSQVKNNSVYVSYYSVHAYSLFYFPKQVH